MSPKHAWEAVHEEDRTRLLLPPLSVRTRAGRRPGSDSCTVYLGQVTALLEDLEGFPGLGHWTFENIQDPGLGTGLTNDLAAPVSWLKPTVSPVLGHIAYEPALWPWITLEWLGHFCCRLLHKGEEHTKVRMKDKTAYSPKPPKTASAPSKGGVIIIKVTNSWCQVPRKHPSLSEVVTDRQQALEFKLRE